MWSKARGKTTKLVVLLIGIGLLLAACGSGSSTDPGPVTETGPSADSGAAVRDTVRVGLPSPVQYFDPQLTQLVTDIDVQLALYDRLIDRDLDGNLRPGLATEWRNVSPTVWELKLREGVKFTNGEPFNADTVVYNVERVSEPGFQEFAFLAPLKSAVKVDEYTVQIETVGPYAMFPSLMAGFFMVPAEYAAEVGSAGINEKPVGTGPYMLESHVRGSEIRVKQNPDWWGWNEHTANIKNIVFRILPDASNRIAALKAGEVDVIKGIPDDQFAVVESDPKLTALAMPGLRTVYLRFFPEAPGGAGAPFKDVRVRKAFNHAINIDAIIDNLLAGHGDRTATLMTPAFMFYDDSVTPYEYDPDKAKALLAEAGYADGFKITFQVWSDGPSPNTNQVTQAATADLQKVGIDVELQTIETGTLLQMQNQRTISEFGLWSWGSGLMDPDDKFWGVFHPDSSATFLTTPEIAQLSIDGQEAFDEAEREQIYFDLQRKIHDEALIVPLFVMYETYGRSNELDWRPTADHHLTFVEASFKN